MLVFKFGGASVKDANAVKNLAAIVQLFLHQKLVIVISAMGKTTNALENLASTYFNNNPLSEEHFNEIRKYHFDICNELFPNKEHSIFEKLHNTFAELDWALEERAYSFNQYYDQCVPYGELLSTLIVSEYLNELQLNNYWLDAREVIKTDNNFREAKVDWELTQKKCFNTILKIQNSNSIVITQGFIGCTSENYSSTLGREGSDYTAAIIAYCLNAESVTIWKDVSGVLNADPKKFENTKVIHKLSYFDSIELAYFGATIIHPKTIKPLQNKSIPLLVKSFLFPKEEGTKVSDDETSEHVPSFISKTNQALLSIFPKDFSFIVEDNISDIFLLFALHQTKVNLMQNSAISFSVCIDNYENKLNELLPLLQQHYKVLYNENAELLTIRYYNPETIQKLTEHREIILEQKTRHTCQFVLK